MEVPIQESVPRALLLLTNISQLLTLRGSATPRRSVDMSLIGLVKDAAVLCSNGAIVTAGKQSEVLRHPVYKKNRKKIKTLDCKGKTVLPGLVDSHTHPAFMQPRLKDFELRTAGATYQEIAAAGGGILSSVDSVRKATRAELAKHVQRSFERMCAHGTTTVEAKSGYGLTLSAEIKSLEAIRDAAKKWPGTVCATLLGAHVVPNHNGSRRQEYLNLVHHKMVPEAARRKLAEFVDVYCELDAFTLEEAQEVFATTVKAGLIPRAHVGQFSPCLLTPLLAFSPASLDHMDHILPIELARMKLTQTVATLLPGASYFIDAGKYPDARAVIESGVPVALATDFNPGTSPTTSLPFIMSLACTQMKMTPFEAVTACTINGAHALRRAATKGSIEAGKDADLAVFKTDDFREICYWFGENICEGTVIAGEVLKN